MKDLRVGVPSLTAVTMDTVFAEAAALVEGPADGGAEALRLSLDEVQFIDPYGLVGLWCVLRYLKRRHHAVVVIPPRDRELQGYLHRMNFPAVTAPIAVLDGSVGGRGATGPSDVLLEMTPIEQQADVEQVLRTMLGRIRRILESELGYGERDVTAFCTVLSETCTNILDHSEDIGVVAAQRYTQRGGTRYVVVGVADLGIGIRQSLATRYRHAERWSHIQAIVNALHKEYSRHPDRGLGLFMVSKIVGAYRGSLHLRSGDARLYLRHRARRLAAGPFPGTQLAISLSARGAQKRP
ncbi:MAG TPA: ATP-binding protein [Candidatus Methylomirabilis sp.]|nr:ATP-binding protein [Candidatus Methylomirabilis sp.]